MERERPVISFLTDFGPGTAPAICRGVMLGIAPHAQIVDISHDVRPYAIREGAYLLWTALPWLPVGVHLAVVDPGVGTWRRPIGLLVRRGDVLIGPDNGLLRPVAEALGGVVEARELVNRAFMLPATSYTFHGRDLFAPMAAHLAEGVAFDAVGPAVAVASLVRLDVPEPTQRDGGLEAEVAFVDAFGNVRLHASRSHLERALDFEGGALEPGAALVVELAGRPSIEASWARTFGDRSIGEVLVYEDSSGRLAMAVNQGDLAAGSGIRGGDVVRLHSRSPGGGD